jgi:2-polyprenyl-6-methoxyphenol hydroxylase-like FAD-dependent oxidoreductase
MESDLVVVGAGPAGIATAISARLKGLSVTVLDHRKPPIDKPCGEGLLPEAVAALRRLGIGIDASGAFPIAGITFRDAESSVSARIAARGAYGLRRSVLHELLVNRATELGVRFLWGTRVSELHSDRLCADRETVSFRWLVGADGRNSTIRRWVALEPARRLRSRFGFRRHYAVAPWSAYVEVNWGERCQMIVTPTAANEICVAVFSGDSRMRIERGQEEFPEIAERLGASRTTSEEAGAVSVLEQARATVRGNVALVGDASCAIDGIAGQGLSLAFQQAEALGEALAREDLAYYQEAQRRITLVPVRMTKLLLLMSSSIWLRRKVLRLFAKNSALFARMISLHTQSDGAGELNAGALAQLGWRMLWA